MSKHLYKFRNIEMTFDETASNYIIFENGMCRSLSPNIIKAWGDFIDAIDSAERRRIGDRLQAIGKNRYTAEDEPEQISMEVL